MKVSGGYIVTEFFPLENERRLHVIKRQGANSCTSFLLIHGGNRDHQAADHWRLYFDWLSSHGTFFAIDMLGHGQSIPGSSSHLEHGSVEIAAQVGAIVKYICSVHPPGRLIIVGRSYGAKVASEVTKQIPDKVSALILIAAGLLSPHVETLPQTVTTKPTLFVWAEDDPVIPFSTTTNLLRLFPRSTLLNLGKVGEQTAHAPEKQKPEEFRAAADQFIKKLSE